MIKRFVYQRESNMNSSDKLTAIVLVAFVFGGVLFTYLNDLHDQKMAEIKANRHSHEWELKVQYEQALAEKARFRAAEVGYLCQFIDKNGEVYYHPECK